jgi:hypothetical protein
MSDEQRPDNRQQPKPPKTQYLSPQTAAKKLGIYLPAAPDEFQNGQVARETLEEWKTAPPEWLVELRKNGPHPRSEVSHRLGVTNSALARAGVSDHMTTDEIKAILDAPPAWLLAERRKGDGA